MIETVQDYTAERWWAVCWHLTRLACGLYSPQALWCEERWANAWLRKRKRRRKA